MSKPGAISNGRKCRALVFLLPYFFTSLLLLTVTYQCHAATAQEYYSAGHKLFQSGDYAKAVQYLNAALKLDPKHKNAYYLLGNTYHKQGNTTAAITAFKGYLRLDPGNTQVQAFLSRLQGASPGNKARPAAKHPPGSIVIFDDRYPLGVKEVPNQATTKVEVWQKDAAFGRACLRYRGDVKQKGGIGSTIEWSRAWGASGVAKPGDLTPLREKGALVFWLRGKNGGEYFTLDLHSTPEKNIVTVDGKLARFKTSLGISKYVTVSTEWQKVIIPLNDFPKKGKLWGKRGGGKHHIRVEDMDWTRIDQLLWRIGETYADEYEIFLDEIAIVPNYDAAELERLMRTAKINRRETALDKAGNLVIFDDRPRGGYGALAHSRLVLDETTAKVGKKSFQYVMDPSRENYAGIGLDMLNFNPYYDKGHLEFWVKGKNGDEKFVVQFICEDSEGRHTWTTLKSEPYVIVSDKWRKVKIPLMDFPTKGWHNTGSGVQTLPISWGAVRGFAIRTYRCQEQ
jgi:tetratricopeptide (TPR) repeat protein